MIYDEGKINKYSKGLSTSEQQMCSRTINAIERVLLNSGFNKISKSSEYEDAEEGLDFGFTVEKDGREFTVVIQGSYGNGTCIRKDSDIDIAIISESVFRGNYNKFPKERYGFVTSNWDVLEFKRELIKIFRNNNILANEGNKCIDIPGNGTSRKDFDLVPCLRYRDYSKDMYIDEANYIPGTLIKANDGTEVINYPEQSRRENIDKNKDTNFNYKKIVRIIKNVKQDMIDDEIIVANNVSSFALECLISNVPNNLFIRKSNESLKEITIRVINYLNNNLNNIANYYETNKILKIFENPKNHLGDYKGFIRKLKYYFE